MAVLPVVPSCFDRGVNERSPSSELLEKADLSMTMLEKGALSERDTDGFLTD